MCVFNPFCNVKELVYMVLICYSETNLFTQHKLLYVKIYSLYMFLLLVYPNSWVLLSFSAIFQQCDDAGKFDKKKNC